MLPPSIMLCAALLPAALLSLPAQADETGAEGENAVASRAGNANDANAASARNDVKPARSYRYVYYPTQRLYYATEQQIWFWKNGNTWNYGVNLPARHRSRLGTGVPVRLTTTRPFLEHAYVERRYGKPWRERNASASEPGPKTEDAVEARKYGTGSDEQG